MVTDQGPLLILAHQYTSYPDSVFLPEISPESSHSDSDLQRVLPEKIKEEQ